MPRIGDNALARMGPLLSALRERRPPIEPTPEADALLGALGLDSGRSARGARGARANRP